MSSSCARRGLRLPRRAIAIAVGAVVLVATAAGALGADLWCYGSMDAHRSTSMAMLTGSLKLHHGLSQVANDEQVYNGAGYTNWGFGVPLLQLPFHAIARLLGAFPGGFFPDRLILFVYLAGLPPVLWWSLHRVLTAKRPDGPWGLQATLSFAGTCLVLAYALYPIFAFRLFVYEETIGYFVLFELYALCAYLHTLRSDRLLPVAALAAAAGFGLLIRATGVVYFGVWGALLALERNARGRGRGRGGEWPRLAVFAGVTAPFVGFWLYSNYAKSGSPLSLGYANSTPYYPYHVPIQRFGSQCADTWSHAAEVASSLFSALFFAVHDGATPHLKACHFAFELQSPDRSPFRDEPFLGVTVLVLLAWALCHPSVLSVRRLSTYVPYAALAAIFFLFVYAGMFAWRYAGDFWPLVVLAVVQYVERLPVALHRRVLGWRMAALLGILSLFGCAKHVLPTLRSVGVIKVDSEQAALMAPRFEAARWGVDPTYPSRVDCGDPVVWPRGGGKGWDGTCAVDTFTNVYLGVPRKTDVHYDFVLHTRGIDAPSLRVYVNGRFYTAHGQNGTYRAAVEIDYGALTSPAVMATVEWTRAFEPPRGGELLSVELV
jgi:hypothetical protein